MNTYKFELDHYKCKIWYLNDDHHRDNDRPAWIWCDGTKWYDGTKWWYQYGKYHRDNDKPACIWSNGTKYWYQYGKYHRVNDKPAIIWSDERVEYWVNDERIK